MASVYDLKPGFQNLLRPLCRALASAGVTANQVTISAALISIAWGCAFVATGGAVWLLYALPVLLFVRMALAGLLVGLLACAYPEVLGNGHAPTNRLLREKPELLFVLGLFAAKFLATALTVGSGAVGGVFTPTLFLGAALGSVFEALLNRAGWAAGCPRWTGR